MKTQKILCAVLQATILVLTLSCSNSEDSQEKGSIKETQDKIAQEAVDSIKEPLEQAKEAARLLEEHNRHNTEAADPQKQQ